MAFIIFTLMFCRECPRKDARDVDIPLAMRQRCAHVSSPMMRAARRSRRFLPPSRQRYFACHFRRRRFAISFCLFRFFAQFSLSFDDAAFTRSDV